MEQHLPLKVQVLPSGDVIGADVQGIDVSQPCSAPVPARIPLAGRECTDVG